MPPMQKIIELLDENDFFLWEYYGRGFLGKFQTYIFRSRIKVLMKLLKCLNLIPKTILDVGCGPMFISYSLTRTFSSEYIGIDLIHSNRLKKYRDAMRNIGVKNIEVIRASAEYLPFKDESFDILLSLDVIEHLRQPRTAIIEISRVNKNIFGISLPLENLFQRLARIGFKLMKIMGDPMPKKSNQINITKIPNYHYVGDIKTYDDMIIELKEQFIPFIVNYTPIGLFKSINVNAVHLFKKKKLT